MDYLLFLQNLREACPSFINGFFIFISEGLVSLLIVIPVLVYWCFDKKIGLWFLFNYSAGYFTNQCVKNTACVYRPWIRDSRLHLAKEAVSSATGYSFPSGHTALGTLVLESLAVWKRKNKLLVIICAIGIFLIAFARNWLGAHSQYDVIVSVLLASLVIIINIFIVHAIDGRCDNKLGKGQKISLDFLLVMLGLILLTALMFYLNLKNYPIDYDLEGKILADPYDMLTDCYSGAGMLGGFLIGFLLERHFVKFKIDVSKKLLLLRGLVGIVILLLLYLVILPFIFQGLGEHLGHILKYFIVFFFITFLYPYFFVLVEKKISEKVE
ncbi:MAG: phosphatase PAP2 family protein [Treponema sp.]|nr:phosphatase PAP2 family protein [Treponema sp.]